jgi:hypothetical protein
VFPFVLRQLVQSLLSLRGLLGGLGHRPRHRP